MYMVTDSSNIILHLRKVSCLASGVLSRGHDRSFVEAGTAYCCSMRSASSNAPFSETTTPRRSSYKAVPLTTDLTYPPAYTISK
jgi:hypothetical protein